MGGMISREDLMRALGKELNAFMAREKSWLASFRELSRGSQGVEIGTDSLIRLSWGKTASESADLSMLFEVIGKMAEKHSTHIVLAIDEAQELKNLIDFDFRSLLAHIYDYVPRLQIVLTGSEVALSKDSLGSDNPFAPLYGRSNILISTHRLSNPQAREFLKEGLAQNRIKPDSEVVEIAARRIGGTIGWLVILGNLARKMGRLDSSIIDSTVEQAVGTVLHDFQSFLRLRTVAEERYRTILVVLADRHPYRWSELKQAVENRIGRRIPDIGFANLLSNLLKASYVEKLPDGSYVLGDPIFAEAAKRSPLATPK
jgi:hypothetical protein